MCLIHKLGEVIEEEKTQGVVIYKDGKLLVPKWKSFTQTCRKCGNVFEREDLYIKQKSEYVELDMKGMLYLEEK